MTSHKHKQKVAQKFYKRKQNANINVYTSNWQYKFVHTEFVQISMILIGSAYVLWNLKEKQQKIPKNASRYTKKNWDS
jgi:hypothetical protein